MIDIKSLKYGDVVITKSIYIGPSVYNPEFSLVDSGVNGTTVLVGNTSIIAVEPRSWSPKIGDKVRHETGWWGEIVGLFGTLAWVQPNRKDSTPYTTEISRLTDR